MDGITCKILVRFDIQQWMIDDGDRRRSIVSYFTFVWLLVSVIIFNYQTFPLPTMPCAIRAHAQSPAWGVGLGVGGEKKYSKNKENSSNWVLRITYTTKRKKRKKLFVHQLTLMSSPMPILLLHFNCIQSSSLQLIQSSSLQLFHIGCFVLSFFAGTLFR